MIELLGDNQYYERCPDPNNPLKYVECAVASGPPTNQQIKDKINEIINYLNQKEPVNFMF